MVGCDYVARYRGCLGEYGRQVSIGTRRGAKSDFPIIDVRRRRLNLTGSTLRPRSVGFKSMIAVELEKSVWPFVREGKLRPVMDSRFPLTEAAAAHARMETGEHIGKIVLLL